VRTCLSGIVGIGLLSATVNGAVAQEGAVVGFVDLPDLVADLASAITEARLIDNEPPFFLIENVTLNLKGTWSEGVDAAFRIPIWTFGLEVEGEGSSTSSEQMELTLVPAQSALVGGRGIVDLEPVIRALKEAFSDEQQEVLRAQSVTFTRNWLLEKSAGAGADLAVIKLGGDIASEQAQSITFSLCQTVDMDTCGTE
jgi:hypothetical protein